MELKETSLLTWMATNRDPDFLENVIYALEHKANKKVTKVYYLHGCKNNAKDIKEVTNRLAEVNNHFKDQIQIVPLDAGILDVDNHNKVMESVMKILSPRLQEMGDFCINISSGTPTMNTIWMVLSAMDFFKGRATFYDAQKYKPSIHKTQDVGPKEEQKIEEISFGIKGTYLELIKKIQKVNTDGNPLSVINSKSPTRQKAFEKISKFAAIEGVPMFFRGERGVGKSNTVETLVKAIKKKDVISVSCGSWNSNLAESKIFGSKEGAYTGNKGEIKGLLETANGKILFLDEIQDLPRDVQRKLLNTIQDKGHPYRRLGDPKEYTADAEFVFASNFPTEKLRECLDPDFFDRISFFTVTIPSLKDCKEDIHEDWKKIWNSCTAPSQSGKQKKQTNIPKIAPWNEQLAEFFSKDINLQGNLRSLQLVAYQMIAWEAWGDSKKLKEILTELEEQNIETDRILHRINSENSINSTFNIADYPEFTQGTWDDAETHFRAKLAKWAQSKYGSWKKAEGPMGKSARTLMDAANAEGK